MTVLNCCCLFQLFIMSVEAGWLADLISLSNVAFEKYTHCKTVKKMISAKLEFPADALKTQKQKEAFQIELIASSIRNPRQDTHVLIMSVIVEKRRIKQSNTDFE